MDAGRGQGGLRRPLVLAGAVVQPRARRGDRGDHVGVCCCRLRCYVHLRLPTGAGGGRVPHRAPVRRAADRARRRRSRCVPSSERPVAVSSEWCARALLRDHGAAVHLPLDRRRHRGDRRTHAGRCVSQPRRRVGHDLVPRPAAEHGVEHRVGSRSSRPPSCSESSRSPSLLNKQTFPVFSFNFFGTSRRAASRSPCSRCVATTVLLGLLTLIARASGAPPRRDAASTASIDRIGP